MASKRPEQRIRYRLESLVSTTDRTLTHPELPCDSQRNRSQGIFRTEPSTTTRHRPRRHDTQAHRVSLHQLPWRQVTNPYPPIQPLSADQIESVHEASLKILKEIGMKVLLPQARTILQKAGADVDEASQIVKFDSGL